MSTLIVYKTLISTYERLNRNTTDLALKIDTAYALGRLSDEDYAELILLCAPE